MRDHYDFSNAVQNPYAAQLKRQVTVSVDAETVDYFQQQADSTGIPVDRLTYKGYGMRMPVADNDTEEGRAANRRTEFKIIRN